MSQEYVFRFLAVRPGNQRNRIERGPKTVRVYDDAKSTPLATQLKRLHDAGAGDADVLRVVRAYQAGKEHLKSLADAPLALDAALDWIATHSRRPARDVDLAAGIQAVHGAPAKKVVAGEDFKQTLARVSDTLVAEAFHASWPVPTDRLAMARKWLALVQLSAAGGAPQDERPFGMAIADLLLSIPEFARLPPPPAAVEPPPPPPPREDEAERERERLRKRLADLEVAHREVSRKAIDDDALKQEPSGDDVAPRLHALEHRIASMEGLRSLGGDSPAAVAAGRLRGALSSTSLLSASGAIRLQIRDEAIARLSEASRRALQDARVDLRKLDPVRAVNAIEEEMQDVAARLQTVEPAQRMLMLGGVMLDAVALKGAFAGKHDATALLKAQCHFQAGVGDLLMVKQDLKAYELAEFAHVENVLAGESRVREHRRLNVREEVVTEEEEREIERERNLQSTERNEMQAEAEKTVKSQFELDAGLQVSGSYGPVVTFSASLNVGFSTSTEETQRKAVSFSREVTEKTSERVRERVRKEVRRRMLEQVEELNRHAITNEPASNGHVRGIYRWLNKVYDAQILNYGQRMMFEFVVPEPAAFLIHALLENPPGDNELVKPLPPSYGGQPLKPAHLTRTNYMDYVARYQVRNVQAPPPEFQTVAMFDRQDKVQDGSTFGRGGKVDVPGGYYAYAATVMSDYSFTEGKTPGFRVMVGGASFDRTSFWGGEYKGLGDRHKEVGIAFHVHNAWSFAIAIEVHCRLAPEGFAKWQQAAYDSIMESYLVQKSDYEEKLAALAIQQGVKVLGRNPLENRRLEREELKKLVLMMLMRDTSIARNSMKPGAEPVMDLLKACTNGNWIRFFENAFEWNNLMYVLYPYFWGRKARWISALHFKDPDPDFAAFLKAGAARVQVPVRPGFEKAVAHFCQFGAIWEGNDPPLRDDDLYVPIVDEIAENLGKLDAGVPYPDDAEPWEVRIPTSLVLVQNLEEIPAIRDMLTGNAVAITS